MMCYSNEPKDQIFVKSYEFFSFAKNMYENLGKDITKNLIQKNTV